MIFSAVRHSSFMTATVLRESTAVRDRKDFVPFNNSLTHFPYDIIDGDLGNIHLLDRVCQPYIRRKKTVRNHKKNFMVQEKVEVCKVQSVKLFVLSFRLFLRL